MAESQAAFKVKFLRGSEAANDIYTGPEGELSIDTTNWSLRIHDGVTPGGHPVRNDTPPPIVDAPMFVFPESNGDMVSTSAVLQLSDYSGTDNLAEPLYAYWYIATDSAFTDVVYESGRTSEDLTSLDLSGLNLPYGVYYAKAQHVGTKSVVSDHSSIRNFEVVFAVVRNESSILAQPTLPGNVTALGNEFGTSLAYSPDGNHIALAAPQATVDGTSRCGAIFMYTKDGTGNWSQSTTLTAQFPNGWGLYGNDMTFSADSASLIVGSQGGMATSGGTADGIVDIYTHSGGGSWTRSSTLTPWLGDNGNGTQYFGSAVSISSDGQTLAVGASRRGVANYGEGAVFVFNNDGAGNWSQNQLVAMEVPGASFGSAVAIANNAARMIVGASNTEVAGANLTGRVHTFVDNGSGTLIEDQVIERPAEMVASSTKFGVKLVTDQQLTRLVVTTTKAASEKVAAYTFENNAWVLQEVMSAGDIAVGDNSHYGFDIAMNVDGTVLAVTDPYVGLNAPDDYAGAVYVYNFNATTKKWAVSDKLLTSDLAVNDQYGEGVAISGTSVVAHNKNKEKTYIHA